MGYIRIFKLYFHLLGQMFPNTLSTLCTFSRLGNRVRRSTSARYCYGILHEIDSVVFFIRTELNAMLVERYCITGQDNSPLASTDSNVIILSYDRSSRNPNAALCFHMLEIRKQDSTREQRLSVLE